MGTKHEDFDINHNPCGENKRIWDKVTDFGKSVNAQPIPIKGRTSRKCMDRRSVDFMLRTPIPKEPDLEFAHPIYVLDS